MADSIPNAESFDALRMRQTALAASTALGVGVVLGGEYAAAVLLPDSWVRQPQGVAELDAVLLSGYVIATLSVIGWMYTDWKRREKHD